MDKNTPPECPICNMPLAYTSMDCYTCYDCMVDVDPETWEIRRKIQPKSIISDIGNSLRGKYRTPNNRDRLK